MKKDNYLYILSNGRVAAINKKDGEIKWEVKVKQYLNSRVIVSFGQISVENDKLYIGSSGILLCLSTKDGSLIWKNELKGWGFQFIAMADANNDAANAAAANSATSAAVIAAI